MTKIAIRDESKQRLSVSRMNVPQIGRILCSGRLRTVTRCAVLLEQLLPGAHVRRLRLRRDVLLRAGGERKRKNDCYDFHRVSGISYDTPKRIKNRLLFEVTPNEGLSLSVRPEGIDHERHGAM